MLNNSHNLSTIEPLVSVGIPTYNRPDGLRRTLECITGQTYKNLEIIVSDNCSPGPDVEIVVREYMAKDKRIQYYRQGINNGAIFNFQFVLDKSTGEYFMWAADDDEWLPEFIAVNVQNIGDAGSCMTNYITRNRILRTDSYNNKSELTGKETLIDLRKFLRNLYPGMIYGLHKRETLSWIKNTDFFDFWDCYFSFRQIIDHGYKTIPVHLFIAGVDSQTYVHKPCQPEKKRLFFYSPFFKHCIKYLYTCHSLSILQKIVISVDLIAITARLFSNYEIKYQPVKCFFFRLLFSIYLLMFPLTYIERNC